MSVRPSVTEQKLLVVLAASSLVSVGLLAVQVITTGSWQYWFMLWNLGLAWPPLLASWWLVRRLAGKALWLQPGNIVLTVVWLMFLPNAFYLVSDLIHLPASSDALLYDVVMFMSFIWNGMLLGYLSLYPLHQELRRRVSARRAYAAVAVVFLLCSYAIYLGRFLRWNSWDVIINPLGLLVDLTAPLLTPLGHTLAFTTTLMFWVLLMSIYAVAYELIAILHHPRR